MLLMPLKSKISTADAEQPRFTFEQGRVELDYVDWQDKPVKIVFDDAAAVRWQDADLAGPQERDDCAYEILDSEWLSIHLDQNAAEPEHRHLRLCFNACGVFDVICKTFVVTRS
ncbi:MAG: hypothetical protein GY811_21925 [Myxococcales bacterium]|nr:hypothetical protein [Myxococcales bacterium]